MDKGHTDSNVDKAVDSKRKVVVGVPDVADGT